jgi:hypothetical protein
VMAAGTAVAMAALPEVAVAEAAYATYLTGEGVYWAGALGMATMAGWQLDAQLQQARMRSTMAIVAQQMNQLNAMGVEIFDFEEGKANKIKEIQDIVDEWQQSGTIPPQLPPGIDPAQWLNELMAQLAKLMGGQWPPSQGPKPPNPGPPSIPFRPGPA